MHKKLSRVIVKSVRSNSMNFLSLQLIEITSKIKENYNFQKRFTRVRKRDNSVSPFNFVESLSSGENHPTSSINDPNVASTELSGTML